jgi:ubiquinone/menaquinone biosynthesis C-methylase UbiE
MKKEEYKRIFESEENYWWYLGMKKISEVLLDSVIKSSSLKILDAGCGTGGMMLFLKKYGDVSGIDLSPEALKYCQKRDLKQIKKSSIEKILFADENFDLVTSFDVLYHQWVKNDLLVLKEFYRVLKPGGYLLLRVPAYNWLRGKHDEVIKTRHRYTKNELAKKLRLSGFKILRSTYANTILFPIAVLKRSSEKFLPLTTTSDIKPLPKIINNLLFRILYLEAIIIARFSLPFGLSLFVLAQKPINQQSSRE